MPKKKIKIENVADVTDVVVELATKADTDGLREAISELTKAVAELTKENIKWYRAGKM